MGTIVALTNPESGKILFKVNSSDPRTNCYSITLLDHFINITNVPYYYVAKDKEMSKTYYVPFNAAIAAEEN